MQKLYLPFLLLCCTVGLVGAQSGNNYTEKLYSWRIEKDLEYGTVPNYAGIPTTLILDLYKPVGDNNAQRPLMVMVHGGAWLAGCKDDPNAGIVAIAKELAQRGYVVASVNYRLGWHKSGGPIANPVNESVLAGGSSLYAADSSEIIRALYRAQQDVKGAIRWLKGRHLQDSTCTERVMVCGESAGGFIAMAVGFLDRPEEKPASCFALPAAPTPAANLKNQYSLNCTLQDIQPAGAALERPDLGSIDGPLHQNGYDANVIGVVSLFGGVPFEAGYKDWLQGPDTPAVYLYHQTCDGIVPFGGSYPFFVLSSYCNLGFTPWHTNYPITFGNGAVSVAFDDAPGMTYVKDFEQCPDFNPAIALIDCIRYGQNGSYHYTANPVLRSQKIADFLSPQILQTRCFTVAGHEPGSRLDAWVSPNPFNEHLSLYLGQGATEKALIQLSDLSGKVLYSESRLLNAGENLLRVPAQLPAGVYVLQLRSGLGAGAWKVVKER